MLIFVSYGCESVCDGPFVYPLVESLVYYKIFIPSCIYLLIFSNSVFVGLISRYEGFISKSFLWSFIVMKAGKQFTFWSIFSCLAISMASLFMLFFVFSGSFLYSCVMLCVAIFVVYDACCVYVNCLVCKYSYFDEVIYSFFLVCDIFLELI